MSGSTQGIGYAIAEALAREGASVIVNGRDKTRLAEAVARLEDAVSGAQVRGLAADFADAEQVDLLSDDLGAVDILVNNVGLFGLAAFDETDDAEWQRYFDVNVMSGVRLCRRVLAEMLAKKQGRIIFVSSESGVNVPPDMVHYGVTKAAMIALGNGLAKLTRGTDVTVNTILGGPTYSDGVAGTIEAIARSQSMAVEDLKTAIIGGNQTSLLERFIDPQEIAHLAVYLASPLSSATNGAALRADGGVLTTML
ncbi:SDR family NAD(P)-dependent oxidoreductase [Aeromicrobium sp. UC242_57]|uniref:SDR family NAD(P)-dependent oxidoreductase n=1 Tax=Aeromicrobium sp. UC242_57 TaxID=3374624 RepID=UPI0037A63F09